MGIRTDKQLERVLKEFDALVALVMTIAKAQDLQQERLTQLEDAFTEAVRNATNGTRHRRTDRRD